MNFDLGQDELALRDGIRELCAKRFPMERIRKGFDREMWRELAEVGVFSIRGELGLGMTEAVVVFQELGRALVPGPLVGSHLAGSGRVITAIDGMGYVSYPAESEGAIMPDGTIIDVPDGDDVEPLDPLTPVRRVDIEAPPSGEGCVLTAALSAGNAAKTVDLAVAYAKERVQFDRPIGSFQAVKHICADMLVRSEVARAAVEAAGVLLDEESDEAGRAVATAKMLASEAALANAKSCIQVHGGMGFTWEVDAHLFLKRAAVLANQFGGIDSQAETIAAYF
jgi:alkylation response protein AidB-like acyl-CoA dehydrogenase